jgi:hypothetical protein
MGYPDGERWFGSSQYVVMARSAEISIRALR